MGNACVAGQRRGVGVEAVNQLWLDRWEIQTANQMRGCGTMKEFVFFRWNLALCGEKRGRIAGGRECRVKQKFGQFHGNINFCR